MISSIVYVYSRQCASFVMTVEPAYSPLKEWGIPKDKPRITKNSSSHPSANLGFRNRVVRGVVIRDPNLDLKEPFVSSLPYRPKSLLLLLLFIPLPVIAWMFTCVMAERPIEYPSYINQLLGTLRRPCAGSKLGVVEFLMPMIEWSLLYSTKAVNLIKSN